MNCACVKGGMGMVITVASGKGGTGKTTFSVNLAYALAGRGERVRLLDCDVEEPNDHLFIRPVFEKRAGVSVLKPIWNEKDCNACGLCVDACNYNALALVKGRIMVFNDLCHSCGVCTEVCPEGAFVERPFEIGHVESTSEPGRAGDTPFFFAHGLLNIGEALAPNVVRGVKQHIDPEAINIIDAAPGTACPVVAAVEGADAVLLVTEPTPFGLNDLKLAVGLTLKVGVPTGIVINRSDGEDRIIEEYARSVGVPIAGRIPFRRDYAEAYSGGAILVDQFPELRENLLGIFDRLETALPPEPPEELFVLDPDAADAGGTQRVAGSGADGHREFVVISGKGGTGKTTLVASLARLLKDKVLVDNDVDAADLHLLLRPRLLEAHDFVGSCKAEINPDTCDACGICAQACHFDAIRADGPSNGLVPHTYIIDQLACEGCGLCPRVCPTGAITSRENVTGRWYVSRTEYGMMSHARLGIAEENSGRLVAQVRKRGAELAREDGSALILGDGPPGTGCPVIASVTGVDQVIVVTEPTVSGVHDLERVLNLAAHFRVPAAVVINKADLNTDQAARIEALATTHNASILGRIPFDPGVQAALMAGEAVIDHAPSGPAAQAIRGIASGLRVSEA